MLASYFGEYGHNLVVAADLPVSGHHADFVRGRTELDKLLSALPRTECCQLGVVDGRNVWRANLHDAFDLVEKALAARRPDGPQIAPSCSSFTARLIWTARASSMQN